MDEANAIGATSLRAGVLPEAQRSQVRAVLRAYVQARQVYSQAVPGESELTAAVERTKALQSSLWRQAEEPAQPGSVIAGLGKRRARLSSLGQDYHQ